MWAVVGSGRPVKYASDMTIARKRPSKRRKATRAGVVVAVLSFLLAISGTLMLYTGLMIVLKRAWPEAADWVLWVGSLPWVGLMFVLFFAFIGLFEWMTGSKLRSVSSRGGEADEDESAG